MKVYKTSAPNKWSIVRKVQFIGLLVGGCGSLALGVIIKHFGDANGLFDFTVFTSALIWWPTYKLFQLLGGGELFYRESAVIVCALFACMTFVNAFFGFVLGTVLGRFINKKRGEK